MGFSCGEGADVAASVGIQRTHHRNASGLLPSRAEPLPLQHPREEASQEADSSGSSSSPTASSAMLIAAATNNDSSSPAASSAEAGHTGLWTSSGLRSREAGSWTQPDSAGDSMTTNDGEKTVHLGSLGLPWDSPGVPRVVSRCVTHPRQQGGPRHRRGASLSGQGSCVPRESPRAGSAPAQHLSSVIHSPMVPPQAQFSSAGAQVLLDPRMLDARLSRAATGVPVSLPKSRSVSGGGGGRDGVTRASSMVVTARAILEKLESALEFAKQLESAKRQRLNAEGRPSLAPPSFPSTVDNLWVRAAGGESLSVTAWAPDSLKRVMHDRDCLERQPGVSLEGDCAEQMERDFRSKAANEHQSSLLPSASHERLSRARRRTLSVDSLDSRHPVLFGVTLIQNEMSPEEFCTLSL